MKIERLDEAFIENQPNCELSEEESKLFMILLLSDEPNLSVDVKKLDKTSKIYKHFKPLIESFQAQVFLKRIEGLTTLRITLGVLITMLSFMKGAGHAVFYAYYMHKKLKPNTLVTMNVFSEELFPWGMFSEEQFEKIWTTQKVKSTDGLDECHCYGVPENLFDYVEIWEG